MRVLGYKPVIRMCDTYEFFKDRNPLIMAAKNSLELEKRLGWLKEGILNSLLTSDKVVVDSSEIVQWNEFVKWLEG